SGPWTKNLFLDTGSRYRERIVRSSYTWNMGAAHGIEAGVEVAQTIQDSSLLLGALTPGPGSPEFGGLTSIPQPNSHSTVEELRYEPFIIHNWQINPRMTLESSLIVEYSEIEQAGDVNKVRDFDFLKPKLDYRFNASNTLQFRATLEQRVSQLSFGDFSRSTNPRDDDQDTVAGNPDLEPEEFLRAEVGVDYRLANDAGTINARYFYEDYANKIGKIDISPAPTNLLSTNGNAGSAAAYGLVVNGSLRLGFLGIPRALLTGGLTIQESEFHDDPFAPIEHGFVPYDRGSFQIGFRHDLPPQRLNYGFNYNKRFDGGRLMFDIDNRSTFPIPYRMMAWVEKTGFMNLTYRLEANNMFEQESCIKRYRYQGYVRDGVLREIENICTTTGLLVNFRVRATF
ncbi:MAG: TonB-dependent receptor, partial [Pseudohongiellaceae bacterium]